MNECMKRRRREKKRSLKYCHIRGKYYLKPKENLLLLSLYAKAGIKHKSIVKFLFHFCCFCFCDKQQCNRTNQRKPKKKYKTFEENDKIFKKNIYIRRSMNLNYINTVNI